jgi:hypothetical protein
VYDLIASTNRVARLRSTGGLRLPVTAQAQAASDLCTTYWKLLLDPEFRQFIQQALPSSPLEFEEDALRRNITEAIALLVEAGVEGEHAVAALRSVLEPPRPRPPGFWPLSFPSIINPQEFFFRLRDAKDATCELSDLLRSEAAAEETRRKLRRAGFAAVGLALVGLTGGALAFLAGPAVAAGAVAAGGGGAILTAIGTTVFDHNVGLAK